MKSSDSKTVLILAEDIDAHADHLVHQINQVPNFKPIRLNPEKLCARTSSISITHKAGKLSGHVVYNDHEFDLTSIYSAICRNYLFDELDNQTEDSGWESLDVAEKIAAYKGIFMMDGIKWINNPYVMDKTDNKIYQANLAHQLGFNIPEFLVSNNSENCNQFSKQQQATALKQLSSLAVIDERSEAAYSLYTSLIDPTENFADLNGDLIFLNKYVEKDYEIRANYVAGEIFAAKILSQQSEKGKVDFRRDQSIVAEPLTLDKDLQEKIHRFMEHVQLEYAAIDFVVKGNAIYFLEANYEGNFLWLEHSLKQPISMVMCRYLVT